MLKIDNTCLQCLQTCPQKYLLRHRENLIPLHEKQTALTFGIAIHKGLEVLYLSQDLTICLQAFEEEYRKLQIWDMKRTLENGKTILKDYYALYFPDNFEVLQVEQMIEREISKDVVFCGKIDLIGKEKDIDEIFILDHKTSSKMEFILNPNHQFTGYLWLVPEATKAYLNMLGVYALSTKKTKEERFIRVSTTRTATDFENWYKWVYDLVQRIDKYTQNNIWPLSGQCYGCSYIPLCTCESKEGKEILKRNMFKQEKWEPWKKEGE